MPPRQDPRIHIDKITGANIVVGDGQHHVHEGEAYLCNFVKLVLGDGDYIGMAFTTPKASAALLHFIMNFASKGAAHVELIESPGTVTGGTSVTAVNRRRDSLRVSLLSSLKQYDSTAGHVIEIGGGTLIDDNYTWVDKKTGGENNEDDEVVLKPETQYAVLLTSDVAANSAEVRFKWYEHQDVSP